MVCSSSLRNGSTLRGKQYGMVKIRDICKVQNVVPVIAIASSILNLKHVAQSVHVIVTDIPVLRLFCCNNHVSSVLSRFLSPLFQKAKITRHVDKNYLPAYELSINVTL